MRNVNPYLCKKGYYITEQHFDDIPGDGYKLVSTTDIKGPYKTLEKAQQVYNDEFADNYDIGIRGPGWTTSLGYETIWYPHKIPA